MYKTRQSQVDKPQKTLFLTYNLCSKAYFKTAYAHPSCQSCEPSFFFFFFTQPNKLQEQIQKRLHSDL